MSYTPYTPTHLHPTIHTRLRSFDGNNGGQSVSFLSSRSALHSVLSFFLGRAVHSRRKKKNHQQQTITTVPSLSLTANYFWPTYPDRKRWHFFPHHFFPSHAFSIFSLFFMLPSLFILLCQEKGINWKEGSNGSCEVVRRPWRHVIFESAHLCFALLFVSVHLSDRNLRDAAIKRHTRRANICW